MMEPVSLEYDCVVCGDTKSTVYKICNCRRAYLCLICKELMETQKITQCPVCRQDIRLVKKYNIYRGLANLINIYGFICVHIILSLMTPLWYIKNRYYNNRDVYESIYPTSPKFDDYIIREDTFNILVISGDLIIIPCIILSWNLFNILLINGGGNLNLNGKFGKVYLLIVNCFRIIFLFYTVLGNPSKIDLKIYLIAYSLCNLISFVFIIWFIALVVIFKHIKSFLEIAIPYKIFYKNYGLFQNNIEFEANNINDIVYDFDENDDNTQGIQDIHNNNDIFILESIV